ncbi:hypothetical protein TNCV_2767121 [Trichonephila clavipes]|nr:hypothetical protein TNCV_2767121 [Trichonephila clavipes]
MRIARLNKKLRDHGSLVVKVTDSWPTCHEFEPSTTEDPSCSGRWTVEAETSSRWCGMEDGVPAQVSFSSLDPSSKLRGPSPKAHE